MGAFRTPCASLDWSLLGDKAAFARPSLHRKFPFPARCGDRFDDWVVGRQFVPECLHHPVSANRTFAIRLQTGRFWGDFRPLNSRILVSAGGRAFWRRFLAPGLCIQKFRSRRPGLSAKSDRTCTHNSDFWADVIWDLGPALQLFRIESERLKLSAPFSRRIAEPLDADAAGQATFYGRFDKIGCEEGERDGHISLPNAALLASAKLYDRGHSP